MTSDWNAIPPTSRGDHRRATCCTRPMRRRMRNQRWTGLGNAATPTTVSWAVAPISAANASPRIPTVPTTAAAAKSVTRFPTSGPEAACRNRRRAWCSAPSIVAKPVSAVAGHSTMARSAASCNADGASPGAVVLSNGWAASIPMVQRKTRNRSETATVRVAVLHAATTSPAVSSRANTGTRAAPKVLVTKPTRTVGIVSAT